MATQKIYDLAVVIGQYQKDGQTKNRYQNVGAILQKDDGGKFIMLERWFNPAGVPNPDNRSNVLLSMFPVQDGGQGRPPQAAQRTQQPQRSAPPHAADMDDDIPF